MSDADHTNIPSLLTIVNTTVQHFKSSDQISVRPHPDHMDQIFVRVTPKEGWAEDGEFFFWFLLNTSTTTFPNHAPVIGCLTDNPLFTSVTPTNRKEATSTTIIMSTGATAICIPGATSGHKNDYDIASTGAPTRKSYADNITETSLNYKVERTSRNSKGEKTKRTEYIQKHGGELSTIIKIVVGSFMAGPSVFDSEIAANWGMTHIKNESKEKEKERLEMSMKGSKPFNVQYLPMVRALFEEDGGEENGGEEDGGIPVEDNLVEVDNEEEETDDALQIKEEIKGEKIEGLQIKKEEEIGELMQRQQHQLQQQEPLPPSTTTTSSRSRKLMENRGGGSVWTETAASEGERLSRIETGQRRQTTSACHLTGKVESPSVQRRGGQCDDSTLLQMKGEEIEGLQVKKEEEIDELMQRPKHQLPQQEPPPPSTTTTTTTTSSQIIEAGAQVLVDSKYTATVVSFQQTSPPTYRIKYKNSAWKVPVNISLNRVEAVDINAPRKRRSREPAFVSPDKRVKVKEEVVKKKC